MNICGIIAEYNPFHNGHKFHIEQTKEKGATHIVVAMSGNFVQRGDIAIFDKFTRAKMAVQNGADLVVEIPVTYSLSAANTYARAGIDILRQLSIDAISFGSECGDINQLKKTLKLIQIVEKSSEMTKCIKLGATYPSALQHSLNKMYPLECSEVLDTANNTLAIEYLKALNGLNIEPLTVKRIGSDHDSIEVNENMASATLIRKMIYDDCLEKVEQLIPLQAFKAVKQAISQGDYIDNIEKIEVLVLYKLKTMQVSDFLQIPDVVEGLENRLYRVAQTSTTLQEFYKEINTKRYTMARFRRIVYCCLLGITKELQELPPQYIRVLASNEKGYEILAKANPHIPISTKFKTLFDQHPKGIETDILATDIFSMCMKTPQQSGRDFLNSPNTNLK